LGPGKREKKGGTQNKTTGERGGIRIEGQRTYFKRLGGKSALGKRGNLIRFCAELDGGSFIFLPQEKKKKYRRPSEYRDKKETWQRRKGKGVGMSWPFAEKGPLRSRERFEKIC